MVQINLLLLMALGAAMIGVSSRILVTPLIWFGMAFVLHASRSMPVVAGSACLWLVTYVALFIGQRDVIPAAGGIYFAVIAVLASTTILPFVIDRLVIQKNTAVGATMTFPIVWVAVEFLRSRFVPGATWGSIAYTQYGWLTLMQMAAFAGIAGIAFLIAWFASTLQWAWNHGFQWNAVRTPVLIYVVTFTLIILAGAIRISMAPTDRPSLRVATLNRPIDLFIPGEMTRITEGNVAPEQKAKVNEKLTRLHDWFLEGSRREAHAGARLIVWPEQNLLVFAEHETNFLERARQLAAEERVFLAMGMGTIHLGEKFPFENKLVLIDPLGHILFSYRKSHPVEGWEAGIMRMGDKQVPIATTAEQRMAGAICYDADFPEFIRQAGEGGADLLIVAANDWKEIKYLHFQMQAFRAIENGVPLVRAAASGMSAAVDPWGRVLGMTDYFALGDRTLITQLPIGGFRTLYSRTGDLFAWFCVAGFVLVLSNLLRQSAFSRGMRIKIL